jgi:CubicO group peptidase (beta-lactamase class C family)
MRRTLLALTAALIFLVQSPTRAEDLAYIRFGDFLEALRIQAGIPGMVAAVVGRSSVQWERVFGDADVDKNIDTRIDTPFHLDGITETLTASLVMRCVEEGRISLTDLIGRWAPDSVDAPLTVHHVLTHTSGPVENLVYQHRPDRFEALSVAVAECTATPFRTALTKLFDTTGMVDSLAGVDIMSALLPATDPLQLAQTARYAGVLERLAVPYSVDLQAKKISVGQYTSSTLTAVSGAISTVQDLEKFDLSLKNGVQLLPETIALMQAAPLGPTGLKLPHGIGWFSQNYLGENIYWQFGVSETGGSGLIIIWPTRSLTFIVLANSNALVKPYNLEKGDVRTTPFAKLFLSLFIR